VRRIKEPPDPAVVERLKEIMTKKAPWDDDWKRQNLLQCLVLCFST
jgi:hypothetical protein